MRWHIPVLNGLRDFLEVCSDLVYQRGLIKIEKAAHRC
jgi:hypothetical protein